MSKSNPMVSMKIGGQGTGMSEVAKHVHLQTAEGVQGAVQVTPKWWEHPQGCDRNHLLLRDQQCAARAKKDGLRAKTLKSGPDQDGIEPSSRSA